MAIFFNKGGYIGKCLVCQKVELTPQELHSPRQVCMFCMYEFNTGAAKSAGISLPPIEPAMYGRSQEDLERFLATNQRAAEEPLYYKDAGGKGGDPEIATMMRAMESEMDAESTTLNVVASEDYSLNFTLPGFVPKKVRDHIQSEMKVFFVETTKLIFQSRVYGKYIYDPDRTGQIPGVGFNKGEV